MLFIENDETISLHVSTLETICHTLSSKDVELLLVDAGRMQALNKEHRGIDKTTDVLSFPLVDFPHTPLGSIVINYELAQKKADEFGHSREEEMTLLFIHGMLHLLGYDHEVDNGEMRAKEEALIAHYNLPKSLIVRVES